MFCLHLLESDSDIKNIISDGHKSNLGCGKDILENYVNIDKENLPGVDMVLSLEEAKQPFPDNSVSEIICDHLLEHIENYIPLMEEIYRICMPSVRMYITVPYYEYEGAFRDPTHRRVLSHNLILAKNAQIKFMGDMIIEIIMGGCLKNESEQ